MSETRVEDHRPECLGGEFCVGGCYDCPTCGCDIDPSDSFPWHYWDEDCRMVREPIPA